MLDARLVFDVKLPFLQNRAAIPLRVTAIAAMHELDAMNPFTSGLLVPARSKSVIFDLAHKIRLGSILATRL